MSRFIQIHENQIHLVIEITQAQQVRLLHLSYLEFDKNQYFPQDSLDHAKIVEVLTTGLGYIEHHGMKHNMTGMGDKLRYVSHTDIYNELGRKLSIVQEAEGLRVISHLQFYNGINTLRSWTTVENISENAIGLEYVSSFALSGIAQVDCVSWDQKSIISIPHNTWYGEAQWKTNTISELGLSQVNKWNRFTVKSIECSNTGTWSTSRYLPMGYFQNIHTKESLFWQIEHNGSWCWEIGDCMDRLYLQISGPCKNKSHWWKNLQPKEIFETVPAAISIVGNGFDTAVGEMTKYRRMIRRPNYDNEVLPVIFNDYMNCLMGDPTTEKLFPLIDRAAEAGCEYFCIDAGWYSDGYWWDGVGEWFPSKKRFPNGIEEPLRAIREKGMIPRLWLEIEVMGLRCPLANKLPDNWFFMRHGKRVVDHSRYQLDFRNPDVGKYADGIIERLVKQYGVGYIKMDYNIDAGIGTELNADSFGDGLLGHNRAYLRWLDGIFEKYPDLVIENCGSGGMRMDYAMLSWLSIQSSSDQTDYVKNAAIVSGCASAVCPEQCAVWSYPLRDADREQVAFNMVNAMLLRIHQSGHLAELSSVGFLLVKEGIEVYKQIRADIRYATPFWPLGMPSYTSGWLAFGLNCEGKSYLAVWRLAGKEKCVIPLSKAKNFKEVKCIYPRELEQSCSLNIDQHTLMMSFPQENAARLYRLW